MNFQRKIYKNLVKIFIIIYIIIALVFSFIYFFLYFFIEKNEILTEYRRVCESFEDINTSSSNYLIKNKVRFENIIDGKVDKNLIDDFFRMRNEKKYNFRLVFFDKNNEYLNYFGRGKAPDSKNIFFQKLINKNTKKLDNTNYIIDNSNSIYIVTSKLKNGYVSMYIDDFEIKKILDKLGRNYLLTDKFDRIITIGDYFTIRKNARKFYPEDFKDDFNIKKGDFGQYKIYILRSKIFNKNIYLSILFIISLISLIFIFSIFFISKKISSNFSGSINRLTKQIRDIEKGKIKKFDMDTDDEIAYIARNLNDLIVNIEKLTENNTKLKYEKKLSEFKMLESQFNPHFLYNTLEIISITMYMDLNTSNEIIQNLTDILRYSINNLSFVHLDEDLEYIHKFLKIQKIKYAENLDFNIHVDEKLSSLMVPKLFLEPMIENSIKYAFKNKEKVIISIDIKRKDDLIIIIIKDNGDKLGDLERIKLNNMIKQKSESGFFIDEHIGLYNSLNRLKLLYKKDLEMYFDEDDNVKLIIKFRR